MKKIHNLGFFNFGNIGDEAYRLAFPKLFPDYEFVFCNSLKNVETDTVILGGGDVLSNDFISQVKKYNKKYAFSVNYRDEDIFIFDEVIARNFNSKVPYYPDFAFILEGNKQNGRALIENLFLYNNLELYENIVILTLNSYLCMKQNSELARDYVNFDKVCYDLAKLMDNTCASFILMPFGNGYPHNDRIANSAVYTKCKYWKKNLLLFNELNVQETLDVFSAVNAAITTRLHAGIFSCIAEIPFIDITHHSKTGLFLESIGKSEWGVDYWHFDYWKTLNLLDDFLKNKTKYKKEVNIINNHAKELLRPLQNKKL